jgi:hypothetical protein
VIGSMRSTVAALIALSALVHAPAPPAQPASADLPTVLARASAYLAGYVKSLSSVVSEERYVQSLYRKGGRSIVGTAGDVSVNRTLVSDYLLVAVGQTSEWLPFRDVYSVDGVPIRDRNDRLLKLFVDAPADAYRQALRIRDESSRYNIGSGLRDTNVPTFALQFLSDQLRSHFAFTLKGRERQDGVDAVVVEFVETAAPTAIAGAGGEDVPAKGRYWIDPADGRILRTRLETRPSGWTNTIDVVFRHEPTLGILVPAEMVERRSGGLEALDGRASYTNLRRFQVDTTIQIK